MGGDRFAEPVPPPDPYHSQRVYHEPALYAPLPGFYSLTYGTDGLEAAMNEQLSGTPTSQFVDRAMEIITGATPEGDQVELTIDPELQRLAYDALPDGVPAPAEVTDPRTGEIWARVSKPAFDTNALTSPSATEPQSGMPVLPPPPGRTAFPTHPRAQLACPCPPLQPS